MGLSSSCFKPTAVDIPTPDAETRRRQIVDAAERRQRENESRGIQDVNKFKRQKQKAEEMEKRQETAARLESDAPVLKWQSN